MTGNYIEFSPKYSKTELSTDAYALFSGYNCDKYQYVNAGNTDIFFFEIPDISAR
jgi:hypothetical protein